MPKNEILFTDVVDGACAFSNAFELSVNTANKDFIKWRQDVLMTEEMEELKVAVNNEDIIGIIDESMDVAFLAITQAYHAFRSLGFSHIGSTWRTRAAFLEVCKTNLRKNVPTEAGMKITKPGDWTPPNIKRLVELPKKDEPEVDLKNLPEAVDA